MASRRRWMNARSVLLLIVVFLGSCSWLTFSNLPDPSDAEELASPVVCKESPAAPVVDTIGTWSTFNFGVGLIYTGVQADSDGLLVAGTGSMVTSIVWGFAAGYGYRQSTKCGRVRAEVARVEMERKAARRRMIFFDQASRSTKIKLLEDLTCSTGRTCQQPNPAPCGRGNFCDSNNGQCLKTDCVEQKWSGYAQIRAEDRSEKAEKLASLMDDVAETREPDEEKHVYSLEEAAKLMEVSTAAIRDWIDSGKLDAAKLEGGFRISKGALSKFWREEMDAGPLFPGETAAEDSED